MWTLCSGGASGGAPQSDQATSWALKTLLVSGAAGCVPWQGNDTSWIQQLGTAVGWVSQLFLVWWGLRLCSPTGWCHLLDSTFRWGACRGLWLGGASVCALWSGGATGYAPRFVGATTGALQLGRPLAVQLCCTLRQGCWSGTPTGHDLLLYSTVVWGWRLCSVVRQAPWLGGTTGYVPWLDRVTGWAPCLGKVTGYIQQFSRAVGQGCRLDSKATQGHCWGSLAMQGHRLWSTVGQSCWLGSQDCQMGSAAAWVLWTGFLIEWDRRLCSAIEWSCILISLPK